MAGIGEKGIHQRSGSGYVTDVYVYMLIYIYIYVYILYSSKGAWTPELALKFGDGNPGMMRSKPASERSLRVQRNKRAAFGGDQGAE